MRVIFFASLRYKSHYTLHEQRHGSGHMVPQFRPQAALRMLRSVLSESYDLAPLLKQDSALVAMTGDAFSEYLDEFISKSKEL